MSDMKSKLPDLKELASMTSKLYNDIKVSVTQIIHDYKEVRAKAAAEEELEASAEAAKPATEKKPAPKAAKSEAPVEVVQKATIVETSVEVTQETVPNEEAKTGESKK
jgi:pyruvate-formate lyase-activating enzyme